MPLLILAGIFLFIVIEYLFMAKHDHSHGHEIKHPKEVEGKKKVEKKDEKKKGDTKEENTVDKVKTVSDEVEEAEEHSSAMPFLISDFMHNFTDGIAVGAAYAVNL